MEHVKRLTLTRKRILDRIAASSDYAVETFERWIEQGVLAVLFGCELQDNCRRGCVPKIRLVHVT